MFIVLKKGKKDWRVDLFDAPERLLITTLTNGKVYTRKVTTIPRPETVSHAWAEHEAKRLARSKIMEGYEVVETDVAALGQDEENAENGVFLALQQADLHGVVGERDISALARTLGLKVSRDMRVTDPERPDDSFVFGSLCGGTAHSQHSPLATFIAAVAWKVNKNLTINDESVAPTRVLKALAQATFDKLIGIGFAPAPIEIKTETHSSNGWVATVL